MIALSTPLLSGLLPFLLPALLGCTGPDPGPGDSAGAQPAPDRPAEPPAWAAPGTEDALAFPWGVQAGDPGTDSVRLSVRTDIDPVSFVVMADDGAGGWVEVARTQASPELGAVTVQVEVAGLAPDTVHAWAVYAQDGSRSRVGRFRTAPDAQAWRKLTLAATSCLGGNEPLANMSLAAARAPDLSLLLGDTVYADGAQDLPEYRAFWDAAFRVPGLADYTAGAGVVATWDDHEVQNNWTAEELVEGQLEAALTAYRESLPQGQGPSGGVWRQQSWGGIAELFVLDVRSERDPVTAHYISAEQEDWLLAGLQASAARFKLVITSVPISDYSDFLGEAAADDRWQGWPEQRSRILRAIEDQGIEGVLWIGGDVHFTTVSTVGLPGDPGAQAWEVAVGPAGRSPNVAADLYQHDGSRYLALFSTYNTAFFTLDPGLGTVGLEFLADDGSVIQSLTIEP